MFFIFFPHISSPLQPHKRRELQASKVHHLLWLSNTWAQRWCLICVLTPLKKSRVFLTSPTQSVTQPHVHHALVKGPIKHGIPRLLFVLYILKQVKQLVNHTFCNSYSRTNDMIVANLNSKRSSWKNLKLSKDSKHLSWMLKCSCKVTNTSSYPLLKYNNQLLSLPHWYGVSRFPRFIYALLSTQRHETLE